jgi:predicted ATPase
LNIKDYHDTPQTQLFYKLTSKYFVNKDFILSLDEENNLVVNIYDKRSGMKIKESMLSSGEYKVLRIIKVLCFSNKFTYYLFDEPELSLSIYWQSMLIEDLLSYAENKLVIVATQSPYLLNENQMDLISTVRTQDI